MLKEKPEFNVRDFESNKVSDQLFDLRDEPLEIAKENKSKLNIVFVKSMAPKQKEKYVLNVMPVNREITRSLSDLYWLRSNLSIEFPYYYV